MSDRCGYVSGSLRRDGLLRDGVVRALREDRRQPHLDRPTHQRAFIVRGTPHGLSSLRKQHVDGHAQHAGNHPLVGRSGRASAAHVMRQERGIEVCSAGDLPLLPAVQRDGNTEPLRRRRCVQRVLNPGHERNNMPVVLRCQRISRYTRNYCCRFSVWNDTAGRNSLRVLRLPR
jgi:hypothetical protein